MCVTVNKLYMLPAGRCQVDHTVLDTNRAPGELANLPIWVYLIETTDGPILVDAGMPASCVTAPLDIFRGTEDEGFIVPKMTEEDVVTRVLVRSGYAQSDLACVVSTHWHFDHAGGNALFPDTEIVVQRREYDAAMTQDNYFEICKDPSLHYRFVNGDTELAPGITLLLTPGHTPGHQSVLVQTNNGGSILLTIDAAYCRANYEDSVPFAVRNASEAAASIRKLKEIAKSAGAKVFFGHDQEQEKLWNTYPLYY